MPTKQRKDTIRNPQPSVSIWRDLRWGGLGHSGIGATPVLESQEGVQKSTPWSIWNFSWEKHCFCGLKHQQVICALLHMIKGNEDNDAYNDDQGDCWHRFQEWKASETMNIVVKNCGSGKRSLNSVKTCENNPFGASSMLLLNVDRPKHNKHRLLERLCGCTFG